MGTYSASVVPKKWVSGEEIFEGGGVAGEEAEGMAGEDFSPITAL
jgi:hypothetical protein